ncbi:putative quinol monooxygenase [Nocardia sp. NPDC050175]|uniref:putative quinol monooxygenase n=1 Tax=Nocardia sp. NPDC050175 TaxID=3364317 RepID=UPI00379005B3
MPIHIVVQFDIEPVRSAEVHSAFRALVAETQIEPGVTRFDAYRAQGHPNRVVLVEEWVDQAAIDEHMTHGHTAEFRKITSGAFGDGPQVNRLDIL